MSFVDQKPRRATEEDCKADWNGGEGGVKFRCYLCGHKFVVGDYWRFVLATHKALINFLVCEKCDGDDVLDKWIDHNEILKTKYWWVL